MQDFRISLIYGSGSKREKELVNEVMHLDEVTQEKCTEKDEQNLEVNFRNQYLRCIKGKKLYIWLKDVVILRYEVKWS